jgi:hypothetical protein
VVSESQLSGYESAATNLYRLNPCSVFQADTLWLSGQLKHGFVLKGMLSAVIGSIKRKQIISEIKKDRPVKLMQLIILQGAFLLFTYDGPYIAYSRVKGGGRLWQGMLSTLA